MILRNSSLPTAAGATAAGGKARDDEPNENENKTPGMQPYLTSLPFVDEELNDLRGKRLFVREL